MRKQIVITITLIVLLVGILSYVRIKKDNEVGANNLKEINYPLHKNISVTIFWAGEEANSENGFISNIPSAWDDNWLKNSINENEFYFALPYNDFDEDGERKAGVDKIVYWANEKVWSENESMLKNRWIEIIHNETICYAQWEDVGPFGEDDANYIFGKELPLNKINKGAGLDVSPKVKDCLGIEDVDKVSWKFVDFRDVPEGVWKEIITTSGINWN